MKRGNNMILRRVVPACLALTAALTPTTPAQTPQATILTIEMENVVQYQENFANLQKNGTSTAMEAPISPLAFSPGYFVADIATINGRKSKGTTRWPGIFL
jgi:hypothetical protein